VEIRFRKDRDTKNKVRFEEDSETLAIGTLYVDRNMLRALGYTEGDALKITLAVASKEDKNV